MNYYWELVENYTNPLFHFSLSLCRVCTLAFMLDGCVARCTAYNVMLLWLGDVLPEKLLPLPMAADFLVPRAIKCLCRAWSMCSMCALRCQWQKKQQQLHFVCMTVVHSVIIHSVEPTEEWEREFYFIVDVVIVVMNVFYIKLLCSCFRMHDARTHTDTAYRYIMDGWIVYLARAKWKLLADVIYIKLMTKMVIQWFST